ncbi:DUF4274 domain-containing protein [uncultured Flavobacterium sp.]|uniref:DUF4274 domain-containing protein n=1 Tax=uncultured Flavobacterium sp. TaxID=165435 RepID=UPI0025CF596B|nr:DUF4274 domain-containing protein [uncultured Flavobacterium sp.]
MNLIEKLQKYSGFDQKTCEAQLAKRDGKFWFALHDLLKPTNKDVLLEQLYAATNADELHDLLTKLHRFYASSDFYDVVMKVFDEDREILESHKLHGVSDLNEFKPTQREVERYAVLLRSFVPKVAEKTREIIGKIPAEHFTPEITSLFKKWMTGTNEYMIKGVFSTNVHDQPDKIDLFLNEIIFNLQPERDAYHFTALRALTSNGAPAYPELTSQLKKIAQLRDMQIGMMANDLLVKYGTIDGEERNSADTKFRKSQIAAMHKRVYKLKTSKGLHNFARSFDWDDDMEFMFAVIRHEKCEVATAKLVYWSIGPVYFQRYASAKEVEDINRDAFRLMTEIEQGMRNGKYITGKLTYDPKNDFYGDKTKSDVPENEIKRQIPEFMY